MLVKFTPGGLDTELVTSDSISPLVETGVYFCISSVKPLIEMITVATNGRIMTLIVSDPHFVCEHLRSSYVVRDSNKRSRMKSTVMTDI